MQSGSSALVSHMQQVTTHLAAMVDLDGKSWTMIVFVTGLAFWIMRNTANALQMLFFLPLATLFSILANYVLVLMQVYEPAKLGDWMVWIIAAATVGNLAAIGLVVLASSAMEPSASGKI